MSAAQRVAEAEAAAVAYQIALTKIGASVIAEALLLWKREVPPTGGVSAYSSWIRKAVALIMRKRQEARKLARAYIRLERALRTGYTIADASDKTASVSLNDLRAEFRQAAGPAAADPLPGSSDNPNIPVEHVPGLDADAERQDREAQQEIQTALGNLGPANLDRKLKGIDTDKPASDVDAERQRAHDEAAARQAAAAERIATNAARGELWQTIDKDRRAIGYIRLSRTGTPCGWCAMLISRGPVYKTKRSAENSIYGDGDLYHDNCHCYAMPVYSDKEYQTSPLYALNREYQALWPKATQGLGGKSALTAWRRYIRTTQRSQAGRSTTQAAQEA